MHTPRNAINDACVCVCACVGAVSPVLHIITANYGVVDGNTELIINSSYEHRIRPVAVHFGHLNATHFIDLLVTYAAFITF